MKGMVISLFDKTGNMVRPWADAGYTCLIFDSQHGDSVNEKTEHSNIYKTGGDIRKHFPILLSFVSKNRDYIKAVFAFPPCTDLAVSGARWFARKAEANPNYRKNALSLVYMAAAVGEVSGAPYFIENPVSVIATEWRKPDFTFHPWEYTQFCAEDAYTKKTCLWAGNGFTMPEKAPMPNVKPDNRIHKAPPSEERANFRSATPMGFARAVFSHLGE